MESFRTHTLPRAAPARVLGVGALLKNTACLIDGHEARWSPLHGDLSTPDACRELEVSIERLIGSVSGPIAAIAHDLHPDFHSTRLAQQWAARLGVPAIAVQHHHAHLAVVQAEHGLDDGPLVGLALDGVGLGHDGTAWGGEVLAVARGQARRVAHLPPLPLPGGDVAAREPWRLLAAVLHATGQAERIEPLLGPRVGTALARGVRLMLDRQLNCPSSTAAGRWFDAAAGALGLSLRQSREAEAAVALEQAATAWLATGGPSGGGGAGTDTGDADEPSLTLLPALVASFVEEPDAGRGAARFHHHLAAALVAEAAAAARQTGASAVAVGGGCFYNRLLDGHIEQGLRDRGLPVLRPKASGCGDAGLALGQAWAAAQAMARDAPAALSRATAHSRAGTSRTAGPHDAPRSCAGTSGETAATSAAGSARARPAPSFILTPED